MDWIKAEDMKAGRETGYITGNERTRIATNTISCSYQRQCSGEGLCLWTKIRQLVSPYTLSYCNVGLLHENRWNLWLCNMLLIYSCKLSQRVLCRRYFCFFYTDVSDEYAANVVTMASFTWMLKVKAANSLENCWTYRREKKDPDHYFFSVCVVTLPWKQRLNFPGNNWCQLTSKTFN